MFVCVCAIWRALFCWSDFWCCCYFAFLFPTLVTFSSSLKLMRTKNHWVFTVAMKNFQRDRNATYARTPKYVTIKTHISNVTQFNVTIRVYCWPSQSVFKTDTITLSERMPEKKCVYQKWTMVKTNAWQREKLAWHFISKLFFIKYAEHIFWVWSFLCCWLKNHVLDQSRNARSHVICLLRFIFFPLWWMRFN